jgi:sporulation protein YlmC with PRC-barrel domain
MDKTEKSLKRDAIIAKEVIDQKGRIIGKVTDILLAMEGTGISLAVENGTGDTKNISWEEVQSASDVILLKPASEPVATEEEAPEPKKEIQPEPAKVAKEPIKTAEEPIKTAEKPVETTEKPKRPLCPTCGQPLTWIKKYKRWYCYNDKKYV